MDELLQKMIVAIDKGNYYKYQVSDIEQEFEKVATKFLKTSCLTSIETQFFLKFLEKTYSTQVGYSSNGNLDYDAKLKPIYEQLAKFYTKQLKFNTKETLVFLQYYYLTEMSKEYGINPRIYMYDALRFKNGYDKFEKEPNCGAYHVTYKIEGLQPETYICYNPKVFSDLIKKQPMEAIGIIDFICTGFHELEHAVQEMQEKNEKITNAQALLWAKEDILGQAYYKKNYHNIFAEKDAYKYSTDRMIKLYEKLGLKLKYNKNYDYQYDEVFQIDISDDNKEDFAINILDARVNKILKQHPELLNRFPVLKNTYNEDGTKKTLPEIQSLLKEQCGEEISLEPSKADEIRAKYDKLIADICETDNDLKFQFLSQKVADSFKSGKEDVQSIHKMRLIVKQNELTYEEYSKKLRERIKYLEHQKQLAIHQHNHEQYEKLNNELSSTKQLLDTMIEYNKEFKEKHDFEKMIKTLKEELEQKLSRSAIDENKMYISDQGYVTMEKKSEEELRSDYEKNVQTIMANGKSEEERNQDLEKLNILYSNIIDLNKEEEQSVHK